MYNDWRKVVPLARLERAAYGLGNRCSILLSYRGSPSRHRNTRTAIGSRARVQHRSRDRAVAEHPRHAAQPHSSPREPAGEERVKELVDIPRGNAAAGVGHLQTCLRVMPGLIVDGEAV